MLEIMKTMTKLTFLFFDSECKGVLGCEWCSLDQGIFLKKPFCTNQNLCFGGMYGSRNLYVTNTSFFHPRDTYKTVSSAPIGPLTSTIIVCFLILTFSVYCFHFQSSRSMSNRFANSATHHILPQSAYEPEGNINNYPDHQEPSQQQAIFEPAAVALMQPSTSHNIASPYQVNSNYR